MITPRERIIIEITARETVREQRTAHEHLTVTEAATRMRCSRTTIFRFMREGRLEYDQTGQHCPRRISAATQIWRSTRRNSTEVKFPGTVGGGLRELILGLTVSLVDAHDHGSAEGFLGDARSRPEKGGQAPKACPPHQSLNKIQFGAPDLLLTASRSP